MQKIIRHNVQLLGEAPSTIERAANAQWPLVEDVGIDHGGADIFVAEEFLDGANVVAVFEEMGGERVAEGVATGLFINTGQLDGLFDGTLQNRLMQVMTANVT